MFTKFEDYKDKYKNLKFDRNEAGVLEVTFHTDGGPMKWSSMPDGPQHAFGPAFRDMAHDPLNKIIIFTGAGDRWCTDYQVEHFPDQSGVTPLWWDFLYRAEHDLFSSLLSIPVPIIAAIPGPASYHAEIVLLADVVLAADTTYFADDSHLSVGVVPGDGIQILWELLVGPNKARHMQYLNQKIDAAEALRLGVVGEVLPADKVLARAREVANDLVSRCTPMTLRATRLTMTEGIRRKIATEHTGSYALEGLAMVMRPQLAEAKRELDVWAPGHPMAGSIKIGTDIP